MDSIDESLDEARIIERALLRIKAIGLAKGDPGGRDPGITSTLER